jgi:hypothetical protein
VVFFVFYFIKYLLSLHNYALSFFLDLIYIQNVYIFYSNYNYLTPLGDFNGRTSDDDDLILVNERSEGDDTGEYIENEIYTLDLLRMQRFGGGGGGGIYTTPIVILDLI